MPFEREMPPPLSDEEKWKLRVRIAHDNMETARLNLFHSDEDVMLKLNKLRVMGFYPVPEVQEAYRFTMDEAALARAYLAGVSEGIRQTIMLPRSGGIS